MSLFHISPGKGSTVPKIVDTRFPAIKATNNKTNPLVTSKTVCYIHALVIDTLTFHSADATYAQAITNSEVIRGERDKLTPDKFRAELSACLLDYYEKICGMAGVGGDTPRCKERPEAQVRGQARRRRRRRRDRHRRRFLATYGG